MTSTGSILPKSTAANNTKSGAGVLFCPRLQPPKKSLPTPDSLCRHASNVRLEGDCSEVAPVTFVLRRP